MCRGRLGRFVLIAAVVAALVALVRTLRGAPAPQFSNHPTVNGGPAATPDPGPDPAVAVQDAVVAETQAEPDEEADAEPVADQTWVAPVEGACPPGFPIKGKLKSAIYHQPGGLAYERTNPDRCYATAEAAEADGLRAAKR